MSLHFPFGPDPVYLSDEAENRLVATYRAARAAGADESGVARAVMTQLEHEIEARTSDLVSKEMALQECMELVAKYRPAP
jgi:hypothetical protein